MDTTYQMAVDSLWIHLQTTQIHLLILSPLSDKSLHKLFCVLLTYIFVLLLLFLLICRGKARKKFYSIPKFRMQIQWGFSGGALFCLIYQCINSLPKLYHDFHKNQLLTSCVFYHVVIIPQCFLLLNNRGAYHIFGHSTVNVFKNTYWNFASLKCIQGHVFS